MKSRLFRIIALALTIAQLADPRLASAKPIPAARFSAQALAARALWEQRADATTERHEANHWLAAAWGMPAIPWITSSAHTPHSIFLEKLIQLITLEIVFVVTLKLEKISESHRANPIRAFVHFDVLVKNLLRKPQNLQARAAFIAHFRYLVSIRKFYIAASKKGPSIESINVPLLFMLLGRHLDLLDPVERQMLRLFFFDFPKSFVSAIDSILAMFEGVLNNNSEIPWHHRYSIEPIVNHTPPVQLWGIHKLFFAPQKHLSPIKQREIRAAGIELLSRIVRRSFHDPLVKQFRWWLAQNDLKTYKSMALMIDSQRRAFWPARMLPIVTLFAPLKPSPRRLAISA